ncbi:MAG: HEAT repeat domain-containing protein [Candidatus Methanoperedens sp.]
MEPLIQALMDKDWHSRSEAVNALGEIGNKKAVEPLIQTLKDKNEDVRWRVAWALGKIGDERAVEPLIQTLRDNDEIVRKGAAWALGKIGEKAVEPLIQALKDKNEDVRWEAKEILEEIGEKAVEPLIQALKDKNEDVRKVATWILGEIGDIRAVESLIQALKDKDRDVRKGAAWALGKIGWQPKDDVERAFYLIAEERWEELVKLGTPAVEPLIQALRDKDWDTRKKVTWALGEIGDKRAVEPLIQALNDKDWGGQKEAVLALGKIDDERAVEPLIQALKDEYKYTRREAAWALGKIGWQPKDDVERAFYLIAEERWKELVKLGTPAVEPLIQALKYKKNENVRIGAASALGEIGEKAVELLIQALKDGDKNDRKEAAKVLGKIREMAVMPLIQALNDEHGQVRKNAAWALGKIREEAVEPVIKTLNDKEKLVPPVPVLLGVATPRAVKPGVIFTARFVAYIKSLEETVKKDLSDLGSGRSQSYMGVESCRWKLETIVTVKLKGKHLKVDPSESEFVWKGERNLVNFLVEVLADAPEEWTVLTYEVFIEGIRVAFIPLDLEITSSIKSDKRNIAIIEPAHTAFASYASQDKLRVLDRVAAVRISAGLKIFMDCLSIHPGEEWKKRLESEIETRDIFLLFWSVNAKNSEWVTWEWKTALVRKRESAIQLHPLQTVTEAPPPEELKKFHFGDVYMIVRDAQEKKG